MKKIVLFTFLGLVHLISFGQQIIQGEYFFDSDPGIGNGTTISISTPSDSVELNFSIFTSSLNEGLHNLYIRMLNDSGVWSLSENRLLNIYKANVNANIVAAEYFFDTDPGIGLGTALSTGAASDSVEFTSVVTLGTVSLGLHNLYMRTKNADGVWSLSENRLVNVYKNANSQIVWSEYFFNTDPGVGNGTGSAVVPAADSVEINTSASISGLPLGQNFIYMRTKNADGVWSLSEGRSFNGCDTIGEITVITGDTMVAACVNQNGITYSIDTVLNADYYVWTLPPGATVVSGDSTTSITVNYSAYSSSGFVSVAGGYAGCTGVFTNLPINFKPIPIAEICYATIDTLTQKTQIAWKKPTETYVNGYVIFRQIPSGTGNYVAIDTVPNSAFSLYLDTGSHPELHAERYKIAVLDSCGNTGDTSVTFEHQTIFLYGFILPGSIAKLYWTDYTGITDSTRFYRVVYDSTGNGPFTVLKDSLDKSITNWTDLLSGVCPNCRYAIDLMSEPTCYPSARILVSRNTSRSNIKNKNSFPLGAPFEKSVSDLDFKIYPNPAGEFVNILVKVASIKFEVTIFDALGKEILSSVSNNYKNESIVQLPLIGIAKGLYFVSIKSTDKILVSKLIVK